MRFPTGDESEINTTNLNSAMMSIFDEIPVPPPASFQLPIDWNEDIVHVGRGSEGCDLSPDGKELWTADATDGTLSIVDIASTRVAATPDAKLVGRSRVKFTPDGRYVNISMLRG